MIAIPEYSRYTATMGTASGGTVSAAFDIEGKTDIILFVPVLNDTPNLTFQVSPTGDTYYDLLEDDGSTNAVTVVGGANAFAVSASDLAPLAGARFIKIVSSDAQSADRDFTIVGK